MSIIPGVFLRGTPEFHMTVRVVTADEAVSCEQDAVASGVPSYSLMRSAGENSAQIILDRFPEARTLGVRVYIGTGNNGGDAWVVADQLARAGAPVSIELLGDPRTDDARRARDDAREAIASAEGAINPAVIVDGVLGTGLKGEASGEAAAAILAINASRTPVVSLDVPSGVDSTTGGGGIVVRADITCTYGTLKRGLLLRRDEAGEIITVDIGLGSSGYTPVCGLSLVDVDWVRNAIPPIPSDAHKGVRRRLAVIGGGEGMAGAPMLAARGAMRSGIGMVQLLVSPNNVHVVQSALPETMAARWPVTAEDQERLTHWAHVLLIGPGLGRSAMTRALVERLLVEWKGPVVLDADALNVFEGEPRSLGSLLGARPALVTPHPIEAARLLRLKPQELIARRFEVGVELAKQLGATVVLKGPPTVISAPDGRVAVSASGAPTLGVAGSGDVLAGIIATLLGQTLDPFSAGCCGAWIHGRAGEVAADAGSVRGSSLEDVVVALRRAWCLDGLSPAHPVLATLPAVGRKR